ncbi:GerAB/ArcD/ProY family transporter [Robertmurraya kyonggiensis]|nr:endospore germination permease [Robertmurraya kyonggiensis]
MGHKVIYAIHIYILLIISIGFSVHVLIIPALLSTSGRDAWLTVILSSIPLSLWILFVFYIYKKLTNHEDFFSLLVQTCAHKWIRIVLTFVLGSYFLLTAFITLKFTLFWAKGNYIFDSPNFIILLLFTIICFYSTWKGLRTISTIAFLVLPFVSFFGFLVGIGNAPNKNYELLFPLFENGFSDFLHGFIYSCAGLFEIILLLFITPFIKDKLKIKWVVCVGIILLCLILGPLMGALAEFGPYEAAKMSNPVYEQWRLLKIGELITRLDFLSIFQWLSGAFVRISLSMFIAERIFMYGRNKKWVLPILYLILFTSACVPWEATSFLFFLKTYFFPISLIFQIGILLLFLLLIHLKGVPYEKNTN